MTPPQIDLHVAEFCARFTVLIVLLAICLFVIWLITIIDITKSEFKKDVDKIVWFFFVMLFPPLGILLYFIIGRWQKSEKTRKDSHYRRGMRYRDIGRD
jgi:NADH:ubiquinone oxidoreductase subunit 6 (subunit J)